MKTSGKWKRFEEGSRGHRKHIANTPEGNSVWVVLWDGEHGEFFFASNPNNWGGSGWYADPKDVISRPEDERKKYSIEELAQMILDASETARNHDELEN